MATILQFEPQFGLKEKRAGLNLLQAKKYLNLSVLPEPPDQFDWELALSVTPSLYANGNGLDNPKQILSGVGDCFFAAAARSIITRTANADIQIVPTMQDVLGAYALATGFDINAQLVPVKGDDGTISMVNPTDQGTDMQDGLKFLHSTGVAGHRIAAWMEIDATDPAMLMAASWMFGPLMLGIQCRQDYPLLRIWDVSKAPVVGGHAVMTTGGIKKLGLPTGTWAQTRLFTWPGLAQNCDQAFAILSDDWIGPYGKTVNGFDRELLEHDLAAA